MLKRFITNALEQGLLIRGGRAVVACSGGPDSMALLDLAARAAPRLGISLAVAHLNHALRGAESTADEALVAAEGAARELPVVIERLDQGWDRRLRGESWEGAARELRRDFFRRVASGFGADRVLLGHTADDLAETVLYRVVRGTGPDGLAGIPPLSEGLFAHPLLPFTRVAILDHCRRARVPWRLDASNLAPETVRNRIRLEVIPMLERINPSVKEALNRLAGAALRDRRDCEAKVAEAWPIVVAEDPPSFNLAAASVLPQGIRDRLLQRWLAGVAGASIPLTTMAEAVRAFGRDGSRFRLRLPGGAEVEMAYGRLLPGSEGQPIGGWEIPLAGPGEHPLPDGRLLLVDAPAGLSPGTHARNRRPGDRFHPPGQAGPVRLKKLMSDRTIPLSRRGRLALVEIPGRGIAWIEGIGSAGWASGPGEPRFELRAAEGDDNREEEAT